MNNKNNLQYISRLLERNGITEYAVLPFSELKVSRPHLLNNLNCKSCIFILIPYNTEENSPTNISKYAAPRDYHLYFSKLFRDLLPSLEHEFPGEVFQGFADSSPFDEKDAVAKSGLGFFGDNGLIINRRYGSFIFIGEIVTTLELPVLSGGETETRCTGCGACAAACPAGVIGCGDYSKCLSLISQKKVKSESEFFEMYKNGIVWGCDICQNCCPFNKNAALSELDFFKQGIINTLTSDIVVQMSDEEFSERAFSWRGRQTITENLLDSEKRNLKKSEQPS